MKNEYFKPLYFFERSILGVWLSSKYISDMPYEYFVTSVNLE